MTTEPEEISQEIKDLCDVIQTQVKKAEIERDHWHRMLASAMCEDPPKEKEDK